MRQIKKIIESILPYLFVFIASLYRSNDPDLGWHLKYGEYFFENYRPLHENTFSTLMSDFHWTNISWGIDVVNYALYSIGGFFTITIAGALVTVLAFYFFSKAFKLDYWSKLFVFPVLLYFLSPIVSTSFRGQTLSLTFFGSMMLILTIYQEKRNKVLYLLPILFLIWANLHGLFILGLAVLFLWQGLYVISQYLQEKDFQELKRIILHLGIINFVTIIATIIHPYGINIYYDAFLHFRDPWLKSIHEYLPPEELSSQWYNLILAGFIASIGLISYLINKKVIKNLPILGVFLILFVLSLWVKRYSWAMYYMMIPLIAPIASLFRPSSKKESFWAATIMFCIYLVAVLHIKGPFDKYIKMNWEVFCQEFSGCSHQAAEELKKYYVEDETMTMYNWGGWLIWNFPELKPSSDGRMHLWRDESGFSAFEYDYQIEQDLKDIDKSGYNVVFTSRYKNIYNRLLELEKAGKWNLVYEDSTTVIFVRNRT